MRRLTRRAGAAVRRFLTALTPRSRWGRAVMVMVLVALVAYLLYGMGEGAGRDAGYRAGREAGLAVDRSGLEAYAYDSGYTAGRRHEKRRLRGVTEVDQLPDGVDRSAAAAAETEGQAYAYPSARPDHGCAVMLRLPSGVVRGLPDDVGEAGVALPAHQHFPCEGRSGISRHHLPGYVSPTLADRPARWEAAIEGRGQPFVYRDGYEVHVDIDRCAGFVIRTPVPPGGVAVPETVPTAVPMYAGYCGG